VASKLTPAQILLGMHLEELGLEPEFEAALCPGRRFRFDVVCRKQKLAIEIDGHYQGKHGAGWGADHEKQNMATMLGWRVLRFSNRAVENGSAKQFVAKYL
jgi:hypothetical protein